MRVPNAFAATSSLLFLLSPLSANAITFDCSSIKADGIRFDLSPLKGEHSLSSVASTGGSGFKNTTYTFNLCNKLDFNEDAKGCDHGSRVCAFERHSESRSPKEEPPIEDAWPIAGVFTHGGKDMNPKTTRLKGDPSKDEGDEGNNDLEGLRVQLDGGVKDDSELQRFIIDLECAKGSGLGDEDDKDGKEDKGERDAADDDKDGDEGDKHPTAYNGALKLDYYNLKPGVGKDKGTDYKTLKLTWKTKYACENAKRDGDSSSGSWGFFTWLFIIVFLLVAAYLVFGSWLNYNRHGARGWDLLPHGDTIRDIPYLVRDWGRRVVSTVQGNGSRDMGYIRV